MGRYMKLDKKLQKISEKSQSRIDRAGIILGLSLFIACCFSYVVLDAYGQQEFYLECPKNAYHGIDGQGNEACRDIQTNQILEPESVNVIDSNSEKTIESDPWIVNVSESTGTVLNEQQPQIVEIIVFILIGVVGSMIVISVKKRGLVTFQVLGRNNIQKEQVRNRQYGRCNMCFTSTSQWKYDYIDGNKRNNELNNCQGLCPDCFSAKKERDNRVSIFQELN